MTRAEAAPSSIAEYEKDHSVSRHLPGSAAGPNKAGRTAPSGGAELGIEMGGEADARRERDQAVAEGDIIPPSAQGTTSAGQLGFGQLNGQEQGIQTPGAEARDQQQQDRNSEWQSNQRECITRLPSRSSRFEACYGCRGIPLLAIYASWC